MNQRRNHIKLYYKIYPEQNIYFALRAAVSEPNNEYLKSKSIFFTIIKRCCLYDFYYLNEIL